MKNNRKKRIRSVATRNERDEGGRDGTTSVFLSKQDKGGWRMKGQRLGRRSEGEMRKRVSSRV